MVLLMLKLWWNGCFPRRSVLMNLLLGASLFPTPWCCLAADMAASAVLRPTSRPQVMNGLRRRTQSISLGVQLSALYRILCWTIPFHLSADSISQYFGRKGFLSGIQKGSRLGSSAPRWTEGIVICRGLLVLHVAEYSFQETAGGACGKTKGTLVAETIFAMRYD